MSNSTLTDREKDNLSKFYEAYSARNQWLLDDPWTPSFGQYPADLELREPAPQELTDENDPAGKPGQHWDGTQGTQTAFDIQEPPLEAGRRLYPVWSYLLALAFTLGSVAFLWAFFAYFCPWFVKTYIEMAGI